MQTNDKTTVEEYASHESDI